MIPIYLIVAGCFGVIKNVSNMIQRCLNKKKDQDDDNAKTNPVDSIISCFLLAWFIAGKQLISLILAVVDSVLTVISVMTRDDACVACWGHLEKEKALISIPRLNKYIHLIMF